MRSATLVLLFLVGASLLVRGVWSIKSSDQPTLTQLQQFPTKDGESVDLLQHIGAKYESLGLCLLDDEYGVILDTIKSDEHSVESKVREIFKVWLQGSGKRPETWATIVSCLKAVKLNRLVDIIEQQYTAGTAADKASTQTQPESEDDEIENVQDLILAVKDVGDWRALCLNLKVDEGKIDSLINSADRVETKKTECLQAYFDEGDAKWSDVVKAVAMHPVNKMRIAKKIAKAHGVNLNKDEL